MVPYVTLFSEIKTIVNAKRTGALFVATDSNRLARFFFSNGDITSITLSQKKGLEACAEFRTVGAGKMKFHQGISDVRDETLPETAHIVGILKPEELDRVGNNLHPNGAAPATKTMDMIRKAFIAVVGPIGEMLFEDQLAASRNISTLVDRLSQELDSPEDIAEFKTRLKA